MVGIQLSRNRRHYPQRQALREILRNLRSIEGQSNTEDSLVAPKPLTRVPGPSDPSR